MLHSSFHYQAVRTMLDAYNQATDRRRVLLGRMKGRHVLNYALALRASKL